MPVSSSAEYFIRENEAALLQILKAAEQQAIKKPFDAVIDAKYALFSSLASVVVRYLAACEDEFRPEIVSFATQIIGYCIGAMEQGNYKDFVDASVNDAIILLKQNALSENGLLEEETYFNCSWGTLFLLIAHDTSSDEANLGETYLKVCHELLWRLIHLDDVMGEQERKYYFQSRQLTAKIVEKAEEVSRAYLGKIKGPNSGLFPPLPPPLPGKISNNGNYDDQSQSESLPEKSPEPDRYQYLVGEINSLIGLDEIKSEVIALGNLLKVQKMREKAGLPVLQQSMHMIFYGNPGTGKTTVARIIGEIYSALGLLPKGHLVETDRSGLVAGYLGQTAIKTKEILDSALGGILFIDEAYSLCSSDQDSYGKEAIDTIVKFMEDHREEIVIIAAGYQAPMSEFIASNPGLKSRFSRFFSFEDYNADELVQIFKLIAHRSKYRLTEEALSVVLEAFKFCVNSKSDGFGNGRLARNLFEKCILNQSNRIVSLSSITDEALVLITEDDVRAISATDLLGSF